MPIQFHNSKILFVDTDNDNAADSIAFDDKLCCGYQLVDCDGVTDIWTRDDLSAYVGDVVKLSTGGCYTVQALDTLDCNTPESVTVNNTYTTCDDCNCVCPGGLASEYKLDYTGIVKHSECFGLNNEWDGVIGFPDSSVCDSDNLPNGTSFATNNASEEESLLVLDTTKCVWVLTLWCDAPGGVNELVWSGEKSGISTPVGTYTRTGGLDSTSTLSITTNP